MIEIQCTGTGERAEERNRKQNEMRTKSWRPRAGFQAG